jgi:hypothetical protein
MTTFTFLAYLFSLLALLMAILLFLRFKAPFAFTILFLKLFARGLSPLWVLFGMLGALFGWQASAPLAISAGIVAAAIMAWYIWRVTRPSKGFAIAFGADW